jgi:hypothetical protein
MPVIKNNEITGWGIEPDESKITSSAVKEKTKKIQPKQDHRKFSLPDGIPQLLVTADKVSMTYKDSGITVSKDGVVYGGKMHLAADIRDIRVNGFWTFNTELLTCLPSTLYTPMPVLKYNTPPFAETVAKLVTLV